MPQNRRNDNSSNSSSQASTRISSHAWLVTAILSSVATMTMYAETMLIPAIPDLINDFKISYTTSSWILAAYLVAGAVMTPISGKLSDAYGKKKILLAIMIIYTASVTLGGFANSISFLLVIRALQGIGLSMFPIAFSIARDQFPRQKIAIGQGIISSMYASGAVIGLAAGSSIVQHYGWQATYYSLIPIAIMLTLTIWKFIRVEDEHRATPLLQEERQYQKVRSASIEGGRYDSDQKKNVMAVVAKNTRLDVKGAAMLAVTITSFLLAITFLEPGSAPRAETIILVPTLLATAIVSLVLFVIIERRVESPLVDLNLFLDKTILKANILILTIGFSMFTVFQAIPVLVENPRPIGFGQDPVSAARVQLPFAIILLAFGPTSGFIVSKIGSTRPIIAGTSISTVGFFLLYFLHSTPLAVSTGLAVIAIGISLTNVGAVNVVILSTPRQNSGISLGVSMLMRIMGSATGPVVAAMFLESYQYFTVVSGAAIQYFPSAESYNLIFLTSALLALFSICLAIMLSRSIPRCQCHLPAERGEAKGAITQSIEREILSWPGVTAQPHRFGGIDFRVGAKEMGHLHGENMADLPLPPNTTILSKVNNKLLGAPKQMGKIKEGSLLPPHDVYPECNWINYWIKDENDVHRVIALFRIQYDRLAKKELNKLP